MRRAVNGAHAQVYSTDESPVNYNAFDKDLQLWVAACMYKGTVDVQRIFVGELDDETADRHYADGMNLGTTLQVPPEMWPADRAAFDEYWRESLAKVHIDDTVREYLYPIAANRVRGVKLPRALQQASENFALLITTGFLPQKFRDEMRLPWSPQHQRRFDRLMAVHADGERRAAALRQGVPVQLLLQRPGLADPDGPPARLDALQPAHRRTRQGPGVASRECVPTETPGTSRRALVDGLVRRRGKGFGGAGSRTRWPWIRTPRCSAARPVDRGPTCWTASRTTAPPTRG